MQNVVFIVMDSLRRDKLEVYNDEVDFTENIDGFAKDATVFDDVVAQSCWTLPSHASMFTGMYPWEHGATQRNLNLDVEEDLLVERFNEEGYDTACFSINGFLKDHSGLVEGFDKVENFGLSDKFEFVNKIEGLVEKWLQTESRFKKTLLSMGDTIFHYWGSEMRETEEVLDSAEEFIEDSENFFVFMNLMDAHEPYHPPKDYKKKHVEKNSICQDPTDYYSGKKDVDFDEVHEHYNASVDYMDDQIGRFFEYLKENNLWEDTTVILTSDHGQMLGEEQHYGHQYSLHEKLTSVPLIAKDAEERENVELRQLYDLIPKWAGISDQEISDTDEMKGFYDFPEMMVNRIPNQCRDRLYRKHKFIRKNNMKFIETTKESGEKIYEGRSKENGASKVEVSDEMKEELSEMESTSSSTGIEDKEEEIKDQLEALGYG